MKAIKAILIALVMGGLITGMLGCGAKSVGTVESQAYTVQRGNLTLDITAVGNLALSHTEDLAVDLFYGTSGTKGTIGEVLCEEGDSVTEGQVLVAMNKSEWDTQLAALEDQIKNAERAILQAQINLKNAEQAVKSAKDNIAARESSVISAEINCQQAQTAVVQSIGTVDTEAALADLRKAQRWYDYVSTQYEAVADSTEDYLLTLLESEEKLGAAQANYDNILSGYDSQEIAIKKSQVDLAERDLAAAREAVVDANDEVTLKELSLVLSQGSYEDSEKDLEEAREDLEEAQGMSPEIKAPFDGYITRVNVAGGDEVVNGAVAVTIADPDKFEANILVSEMDIIQVTLDGTATVTADSMTGIAFPARVTHIAPTATIQSGVVNYSVKVELGEINIVAQNLTTPATDNATSGTLPPMLQEAVDSGRMTQEEAEQFMQNGGVGNFTPPEGFAPSENMTFPEGMEVPDFSIRPSQGQITSAVSGDFKLREGLTVTVSIVVASRTNVILVPNGAVTTEGSQSYVQVITSAGTEKRAVTLGISNWQYTEITDGLAEDEQVEVALNTSDTSTFTEQIQGGMGFSTGPIIDVQRN